MIIVCGLEAAQAQIEVHGARHVISILGPPTEHRNFYGIEPANHLKLSFNDINTETAGLIAPKIEDAQKLVQFIYDWNASAPLLIHCWAGISRSTASAFAAMCLLRPDDDEMELAFALRAASPSATPNRLITAKVDELIGRNGRMIAAVEAIGRGADAFEGKPFILKI
jgi:predicted protein tyrosine phosphatase